MFWDYLLLFIWGRSGFLFDIDRIFVGTSFLDFLRLSKTIIELLLSYPSTTIDLVRLLAFTKSSRFLAKNESLDWERSLFSLMMELKEESLLMKALELKFVVLRRGSIDWFLTMYLEKCLSLLYGVNES